MLLVGDVGAATEDVKHASDGDRISAAPAREGSTFNLRAMPVQHLVQREHMLKKVNVFCVFVFSQKILYIVSQTTLIRAKYVKGDPIMCHFSSIYTSQWDWLI